MASSDTAAPSGADVLQHLWRLHAGMQSHVTDVRLGYDLSANEMRAVAILWDEGPLQMRVLAERVPLCRGRWDPQGSTASQYCWVVWFKDSLDGCAFEWIPPGRRVQRSRPDDVERFTAHPFLHAANLA